MVIRPLRWELEGFFEKTAKIFRWPVNAWGWRWAQGFFLKVC